MKKMGLPIFERNCDQHMRGGGPGSEGGGRVSGWKFCRRPKKESLGGEVPSYQQQRKIKQRFAILHSALYLGKAPRDRNH